MPISRHRYQLHMCVNDNFVKLLLCLCYSDTSDSRLCFRKNMLRNVVQNTEHLRKYYVLGYRWVLKRKYSYSTCSVKMWYQRVSNNDDVRWWHRTSSLLLIMMNQSCEGFLSLPLYLAVFFFTTVFSRLLLMMRWRQIPSLRGTAGEMQLRLNKQLQQTSTLSLDCSFYILVQLRLCSATRRHGKNSRVTRLFAIKTIYLSAWLQPVTI